VSAEYSVVEVSTVWGVWSWGDCWGAWAAGFAKIVKCANELEEELEDELLAGALG
jgi:hypothetical protein